jgi:ABC-type branched-subunit amino acid transport system ATPase component/sugar phosphate permease
MQHQPNSGRTTWGDRVAGHEADIESDTADLAAAVLAEESKRRATQAERDERTILPDDLLPGVGDEEMTLKEALAKGGVSMLVFMFLLNVIDDLPRAVRVVAPDIQETFGISDTALAFVLSFGGVALVLGAVPMATLADRIKRVTIIPIASLLWATTMALSAFVANPFQLFVTSTLTGLGQSYRIPVSNSLLSDSYPVQSRSRVFAVEGTGRPIGQLLGPLLVGGVAAWAGGTEGWRWAFVVLAIPPVIVGLASISLKEPQRGKFDQESVLGHTLDRKEQEEAEELPISVSQAYARLKKVQTFYFLSVGVGVVGFALIAVPLQFNLLLEDKYAFGPLKRGVVESFIWVVAIPLLPVVGHLFDRTFRQDPARMMRQAGWMVVAAGGFYAVGLPLKPIGALVIMVALAQAAITASFVAAGPIIAAVSPFRIRALAFAFLPVFIFLMGGFVGGLVVGSLSDTFGNRTAMLAVAPLACVIGGLLIIYGSRFIRYDISLAVEELLEERDEVERMHDSPDDIPVLQVRNLDFSYGPVQVLFDVGIEVSRGEVLALLGTNGAGKSTLLRAISGLGVPERGVIRLNGRTITYTDAEHRFAEGIVQLRGGAGIFPDLTIGENLQTSVLASGLDRAEIQRRMDTAVERFPALDGRLGEKAGELSGGQQQMMALAMALMHEPEVLIIDELSLGLAPLVVQELLHVIEGLRAEGMTMVIVEQSVNIALSLADRAVFLEKGAVRFVGTAQELTEQGDLAAAVLLGGHTASTAGDDATDSDKAGDIATADDATGNGDHTGGEGTDQ